MPIHITCPQCEGNGRVELAEHLRETLVLVPKKGSTTAENIHAKLAIDITVNGISNRLQDLFLLGLVTRERQGKYWNYTRV